MKKLTVKWLESNESCDDGIAWFTTCGKVKPSEVMDALLAEKRLEWANWLIARLLSPKDRVRYAIFAAEQVIDIFEHEYPDNKRAIEAAKAVLKKNNKTARAAGAAAWAAWAAGAARAARVARAAWAAGAAAGAAWTAGAARASWAARAALAAGAAGDATKEKIIRYGMGLCFGREA